MESKIRNTIYTYDKTCESYADKVKGLHHKKEAKEFLEALVDNGTILDLGCGSGRDARIFSSKGYRVTGIDLSLQMLKYSRKECPLASFSKMDIRKLAFQDTSFDGVWSCASILHLPKKNVVGCLCECYRVLKTNGSLYISVKQGEGEDMIVDDRYDSNALKFYSYFMPDELCRQIGQSGFSDVRCSVETWDNYYIRRPEIRILARKR